MPEDVIYATATLKTVTGKSVVQKRTAVTRENVAEYRAAKDTIEIAAERLARLGFITVSKGAVSITFSSSREHFEEVFNTRLEKKERHVVSHGRVRKVSTYFMAQEPIYVPDELSGVIEAITLPSPPTYYQSAAPPTLGYYHLDVPHEVAGMLRADVLHSRGIKGTGVKLAMVDSGFYNHPYYTGKGYNISVKAVVGDPNNDEIGHGTAIASNALAVAPGIEFVFVKMDDGVSYSPIAGFHLAVAQDPKVITCSWGILHDPTLEVEIASAVDNGIIVVFACGNGGPVGWPSDMPEVISVGGAYVSQDASLEASSFASSGYSARYSDRHVPEICGITGHAPNGVLIAMPTSPGSVFDALCSGGSFPNNDETTSSDGWIVASGTSSAAPQVAGVVALLLEAQPKLLRERSVNLKIGRSKLNIVLKSYQQVRFLLQIKARDVTVGASASGETAGPGQDLATGHGLVDAAESVKAAETACFIASAAYESPLAPEVQFLRDIRDNRIRSSSLGSFAMDIFETVYYIFSPMIVGIMRRHSLAKKVIRWVIVAPFVSVLYCVVFSLGLIRRVIFMFKRLRF